MSKATIQVGLWLWLVGLLLPLPMAGSPVLRLNPVAAVSRQPTNKSYLEKLFGNITNRAETVTGGTNQQEMSGAEWLLAVPATIFYGPVALLAILWLLFTSDLIGIICGLIIIAICLAFTLPQRPRPITLFVLASVGFVLAAGITLVVAVEEGVPWVLVSLGPTACLVGWAARAAFIRK